MKKYKYPQTVKQLRDILNRLDPSKDEAVVVVSGGDHEYYPAQGALMLADVYPDGKMYENFGGKCDNDSFSETVTVMVF